MSERSQISSVGPRSFTPTAQTIIGTWQPRSTPRDLAVTAMPLSAEKMNTVRSSTPRSRACS
jgi:hypothetical protein